jgi:hypothetical protein
VHRFIMLIVVLQLVAGSFVVPAHAEQLAAGASDIQTDCQNAPGESSDQSRGSCDICSHGVVNGVAVEPGSKLLVMAPSKPVPVEKSAAKSWLDHPAGEPPK